MSKVLQCFAYRDVIGMATIVLEAVRPLAERMEIAGSIRRLRPHVGDIDVVVQVDEANPWAKQAIGTALAHLGWMPVREGELIARYEIPGRVIEPAIDVYYATTETWGTTLLVRTGSAAHNIKLVEAGKHLLPARMLKVSQGLVDTAGRVVASRTEEDIFAALGMPYIAPEQREAPEYESWVREDAG